MSKNLIIFDCDGVLVDSEFVSSKVFAETISSYGYPMTTEESIKKFTGINEQKCRQIIMQESGVDIPEDYWKLQYDNLLKIYEAELISLLHPVIEFLHPHSIPICVASNSSRQHVVHCLEITKQIQFFPENTIFTSQQVPKPKPAPDLFLFAAKKMGVEPENCIVIEDSSTGTEAAIAARMQVLIYTGGSHASFEWYQEIISKHKKPMFSKHNELLDQILANRIFIN